MKKYKVRLSDQAKRDLRDNFVFLAKTDMGVAGAEKVMNKVRKRIKELSVFPEGMPPVEIAPGVRVAHIEWYGIYFVVRKVEDIVVVVRVLHMRRNKNAEDLSVDY